MAAHRFWRLAVETANDPNNVSASLIEFRETAGGPAVSTGGVASASSTYAGFDITAAFAGTGQWASLTGAPVWVGYDFGEGVTRTIAQVAWRARTDAAPSQTPLVVHLECSDDGTTWVQYRLLGSFGAGWALGETRLFDPVLGPGQSISKLDEYAVEGGAEALYASKAAGYVAEGAAESVFASKIAAYAIDGSPNVLNASKLAVYVIEGARSGQYSQAMIGTF